MRPLRALVVDDSSLNRRLLASMLREIPGVVGVAVASDGAEALRIVEQQQPDFVTLDLEMPRLDGFEFLEQVMVRRPLPVVVISGHTQRENVFRALELGAIDFLAKPSHEARGDPFDDLRIQLAEKVRIVRQLTPLSVKSAMRARLELGSEPPGREDDTIQIRTKPIEVRPPRRVVVIGASTGGPRALFRLFRHLRENADVSMVIAQHMPPRFTRTFAARLDRATTFKVTEARAFELLGKGRAYVCPGGRCIEVVSSERGPAVKLVDPGPRTRYLPSVDVLFVSAARALGDKVVGVILTGMGNDGARGVLAVDRAGGSVLIESPKNAVVSGMPSAARDSGARHEVHSIEGLALALGELTKPRSNRPIP